MNALAARRRAEEIMECTVAEIVNKPDRLYDKSVIAGIACEMPATRPSLVELADALGVSRCAAQCWLTAWYNLEWRERWTWCRLAEGLPRKERR